MHEALAVGRAEVPEANSAIERTREKSIIDRRHHQTYNPVKLEEEREAGGRKRERQEGGREREGGGRKRERQEGGRERGRREEEREGGGRKREREEGGRERGRREEEGGCGV